MMRIVVTLDEDGQVEVYTSGSAEVVLIDNSVPEDAGDYIEETIPNEAGDYQITGGVYKLEGPTRDDAFVCRVFEIAERQSEYPLAPCGERITARGHPADCYYCGIARNKPLVEPTEVLPDTEQAQRIFRPDE